MARKRKIEAPAEPVPDGLVRIELLAPWGERPAGAVVDVDPVRAEQMIPAKAKPWEPEPETEEVLDGG